LFSLPTLRLSIIFSVPVHHLSFLQIHINMPSTARSLRLLQLIPLLVANVSSFPRPFTQRSYPVPPFTGSRVALPTVQSSEQLPIRPSKTVTIFQAVTSNEQKFSGDATKPTSNNLFKKAYHLYVDYFDRLWTDTDVDQRQKLARQRAKDAVLRVKNMVSRSGGVGEEYLWQDADASGVKPAVEQEKEEEAAVFMGMNEGVRSQMEDACDLMLLQLEQDEKLNAKKSRKLSEKLGKLSKGGKSYPPEISSPREVREKAESVLKVQVLHGEKAIYSGEGVADVLLVDSKAESPHVPIDTSVEVVSTQNNEADLTCSKKAKKGRSVLFGATMGLAVAAWVYSGNYVFTGLFTLMTALGQLEYYRMVMNTGIYPARRISVLGACAMFVTALFAPNLHQICLPVFATYTMIWFLTMRRRTATIPEIATTFTGMFYLGYIPSFWVRIRLIGAGRQPTRLAPIVQPIFTRLSEISSVSSKVPSFLPKTIHLPITTGSNFIFWSWLCIAFSDVGGYFAGRRFGKTKLSAISPAAGKTSPNKTVEGVVGGCVFSVILATLGAWIQKWPYWSIVGPIHGVSLALLGLLGDLTASMLKRDAGLKDFGDFIPDHGGIMDRVDSYIFTAPWCWLMCGYVIPWLRKFANA